MRDQIGDFLQFLVHLTCMDNALILCGSNSQHVIVRMKVELRNKYFENFKIENTSLVGANLIKCNASGSQFNNVKQVEQI
ncbi:unnamed protein product [Paramecium primaurelia]|uniref:Uncharacterized protein n=1 Tax=Paramecium primaurelia TaxID=5886 RepID=A0A8S1L7P6_PARPR|nr:unnamed protein product [Paramecium primaurelia]